MTDFNYPPTHEFTLKTALEDVQSDLTDVEDRINRLEDDDDATDDALSEAYQERSELENYRDGLQWAINEFNEDATVVMKAFTATTRARTLDEIRSSAVGSVGSEETRIWLLAASLRQAPWLDGSEDDLAAEYRITGMLPPALQDYLDDQLTDLNDLGSENL